MKCPCCPQCGENGDYTHTLVEGLAGDRERKTFWRCCQTLRKHWIYSPEERAYLAWCEVMRAHYQEEKP